MEKAHAILKDVFGFEAFRLAQEKAIERLVVQNKSALVLFPTAGGKSLCYQIPALCFERGITLVISPLISLMRDQVDALLRRRVKAASWDSSLTADQARAVKAGVLNGDLKMLYVAPEKLNNEGFVQLMSQVEINLLAVDESHCISQWGAAFRPDYLKIARFVEEFGVQRVLCLTATATNQVAQDICDSFHIDSNEGVFKTPVYRPNLAFKVKVAANLDDKIKQLVPMLQNRNGPVVIYVTLQAHTEECQRKLGEKGISSRIYHAGVASETRTNVQDWFMASTDGIVVCTIAFGMGIDKADLRQVIHLYMPKTLENYSQEVGRAGRDGKPSVCTMFLCASDIPILENFARGDTVTLNSLQLWLDSGVFGVPLAPDGALEANHFTQSKSFDIRSGTLLNLYAQLELKFGLLRAITPCYQVYDYTIRGSDLWTKADKTSKAAKTVLQYARPKGQGFQIDVSVAGENSGVPRAELARVIHGWELSGAVEVKASQVRHRYRVLKELPTGKPAVIAALAQQLHEGQLAAENEAIEKIQGVLAFATGEECLAYSLAQYFGSEKAVPGDSCGICTQCTTGEGVAFNPNYVATVDPSALRAVLAACLDRDDPRLIVRFAVGITSPRLTALKLSSHPLFGSMAGTNHELLLAAADAECAAAGYAPAPSGASNFSPPKKRTVSASTSKRGKTSTSTSRSASGSSYSGYKKSSSSQGSSRGGRGGYRGGRRY
ncbi:ATP-dependent DNA helicase [Ceratobasidium sp. AG-I]|nr:ATP-dependent DNA helicase [Ceratobasidium sp. AG-I]